jgi:prevent-host-death family protein
MSKVMNIAEAKSKLSSLVAAALAGETVELAKAGKPVVRLVPIVQPQKRRLGILRDYGWTDNVAYEVFAPEPEDAIDGPLFPS